MSKHTAEKGTLYMIAPARTSQKRGPGRRRTSTEILKAKKCENDEKKILKETRGSGQNGTPKYGRPNFTEKEKIQT